MFMRVTNSFTELIEEANQGATSVVWNTQCNSYFLQII